MTGKELMEFIVEHELYKEHLTVNLQTERGNNELTKEDISVYDDAIIISDFSKGEGN